MKIYTYWYSIIAYKYEQIVKMGIFGKKIYKKQDINLIFDAKNDKKWVKIDKK